MKAIVYTQYGSPDVLELQEIEKPIPKTNEVLVKVQAASINSWDWELLRGKPFLVRLIYGSFFKPKYKILGADVAGRVEVVGSNVKQFQPGDEVFGDLCESGWGGLGEYVCVCENALALKSGRMTFDQAAAIPQAGVLALQGIGDYGMVQPGQKVLINGAGGGTGTFAIQMAKAFGAEVTGVDSAKKFETMRSIGADHVIDYTQEDFTKSGQLYDLILDVVGYHSIFDYKRALNAGGMYFMIGGSTSLIFQTLILGTLISITGSRKMGVLAHKPNKGLNDINKLFESGQVIPVIDSRYPLDEAAAAFRHFGEGHAKGKVIITL
ncbi:MAG: NAD(P)-dependent alcohol dehydrogenase [Flavobacteriales bacterium]|nr:NAD(P)-dependent alcohol dehydrogenase [Flavobacteriales bacterium]